MLGETRRHTGYAYHRSIRTITVMPAMEAVETDRQRKQREGGVRRGRREGKSSPHSTIRCCMEGATSNPMAIMIVTRPAQAIRRSATCRSNHFLELAVELESEQHLRAKDQEARLVEGVFKLSLQAHLLICSAPSRRVLAF